MEQTQIMTAKKYIKKDSSLAGWSMLWEFR